MTADTMYDLKSFGSKLKTIRKRGQITQKIIQDRTGLHPKTIKNIEHGITTPTFETLDKLSEIYRMNLHLVYESFRLDRTGILNHYIRQLDIASYSSRLDDVDRIIENFKDLLLTYEKHPTVSIKLKQLILFAKLIKIKDKKDPASLLETETMCLKALRLTNPSFSVQTCENLYFDPLEIRLLIGLSFNYMRLKNKNFALKLCHLGHELTRLHYDTCLGHVELLIHCHFVLSYLYHIYDNHEKVIIYAKEGIDLSLYHQNMKYLAMLYFRLGIAELNCDSPEYYDSLKRSLHTLITSKEQHLFDLYSKALKEKYNLTFKM